MMNANVFPEPVTACRQLACIEEKKLAHLDDTILILHGSWDRPRLHWGHSLKAKFGDHVSAARQLGTR